MHSTGEAAYEQCQLGTSPGTSAVAAIPSRTKRIAQSMLYLWQQQHSPGPLPRACSMSMAERQACSSMRREGPGPQQPSAPMHADSVRRKRKTKMNKHKHRKRLKKLRHSSK